MTDMFLRQGQREKKFGGNQRGLSPVQIQTILDAHNRYRSYVYPSAANMKKMEWDHLLQQMAQAWADGCRFQKGVVSTIQHPYNHASLGQNMGMVLQNFKPVEQLVSDWHKEGRYYIYETGECMQRRPFTCDEYTQVKPSS
ncbi:PREDICTED: cysteine-rich secretory protein LCCL domain-containing 1-like [Branchiostoma belcheri]|uniref:Cysteine-rich secretory protein LCCL domain-containing 1-like n=1 Tax=Branchiostoma belcheri TaxID=7741 RepID=A0A6P5AB27_BRABE|nr:PREDICTED: cysteine-rich secretory protein LCCL domain-containing 1-like [Branchiostoma belcheri]